MAIEATNDPDFRNNRFVPTELTVRPGAEVDVRNTGSDRHTLTAAQEGAWPEVELGPGEAAAFRAPAQVGEHRFYCRYHASPRATPAEGMAGVLRVALEDPSQGAPPPQRTPLGFEVLAVAGLAGALLARRR